jgi:serine/arginine repetitive matrix protein 2
LEKERNIEREREWNKRHVTSRPTSSLSIHSHSPHHPERIRTQSHPVRPDSAVSHHTPDHLHRHRSFNSDRSGSPSSSVPSHDSEKELELEVKHEIEHVRERNWNAPRPKWDPNNPHRQGRPVSPLPPSLSPQPAISNTQVVSHPHSRREGSPTVESPSRHMHRGKTNLRPSSSNSSLNVIARASPRAPSPSPRLANERQASNLHPANHASRSRSPLPRTDHAVPDTKGNGSPSKMPATGSHFGWQFPRHKAPLPPLDLDQHSLERHTHSRTLSSPSPTPDPRPTSKSTGSVKASHIPVRSPHASERHVGSSPAIKKHKRNVAELSESVGGVPPQVPLEPVSFPEDSAHQVSVLGVSCLFC